MLHDSREDILADDTLGAVSLAGHQLDIPVPSAPKAQELLSIINTKRVYNMQEFSKHCRSFIGQTVAEAQQQVS